MSQANDWFAGDRRNEHYVSTRGSRAWCLAALLAFLIATPNLTSAQSRIALERLVTGLRNPVAITHAADGSGRLFITLQAGRIMIYDGTALLPSPFLDIASLVSCCGERGLLSVAFDPRYVSNGFFFVNYTNKAGNTVVARYKVSSNPNLADPASAAVFLTVAQPYRNNNGGQLQFGPDGYLYIGMGDGGSAGDPGNRAQDPRTLLGKMLRIDVAGGPPYIIPQSNPFTAAPDFRAEIWALGLHNPWRFSFDRDTGDLWIADVGENNVEEVNFQASDSSGGQNYGWRRMEGTACFDPPRDCSDDSLTRPILQYRHTLGCSITGGYRYRGFDYPALQASYFYADFCSGRIWRATAAGTTWRSAVVLQSDLRVSTFGEDERGELYLAHYHKTDGALYRIVAP
jgi:glucose/arabinose dehydrogenase